MMWSWWSCGDSSCCHSCRAPRGMRMSAVWYGDDDGCNAGVIIDAPSPLPHDSVNAVAAAAAAVVGARNHFSQGPTT